MRELNQAEVEAVNGGFGVLALPAAVGIAVSLATVGIGAVTSPVTGPVGYAAMGSGFIGAAASGVALLASILFPFI